MHFSKPPLGTPLDWENPLNKGTVMALAMNEGHGDKVQDLSLNGNHGTLKGFVFPPTVDSGWNPGQNGVGINFNGNNDYMDVTTSPLLNCANAITVFSLIRPGVQPVDYTHIIARRTANTGYYMYMHQVADPKVAFIVKIGNVSKGAISNNPLVVDKWYKVAGVYDGSEVMIYIDGVKQSTPTSITGTIDTNVSNLTIGRSSTGGFQFKGSIDQPRIQSRAWTAKEVRDYAINPWQVYLDEGGM